MVGALNKIPIAICGYLYFSDRPSNPAGLAGIAIGLSGGIIFTLAKLQEMRVLCPLPEPPLVAGTALHPVAAPWPAS